MKGIIDVLKAILLGSCGAAAAILLTVFIVITFFAIEYCVIAGLIYIISWLFGFAFEWKMVYGIYLVVLILNLIAAAHSLK